MTLHQFLQDVGWELQELLWRDVPYRKVQDEVAQLETRLREHSARLDQLRATVDELRGQLAENERRAAWLEERVAVYLHLSDRPNAWRHALELDRTRKAIAALRDQLHQQRQAYHLELAQFQALRRQRAGFPGGAYPRL